MGLISGLFGRKQPTANDIIIKSVSDRAVKATKLINESLVMANEATSYQDKMSHISAAKSKLEEVKDLVSQYSFIHLERLDDVHRSIYELAQEASQIIPRKVELRKLSKEIGSIKQSCPYCEQPFAKFPQRKTTCQYCKKFIYARKEPLSGEKRLFRDDELTLYDEIKQLSTGGWDWWHEQQNKIAVAREELAKEWDVDPSKINESDARWRIISKETSEALAKQNWPDYLAHRESAIRHLLSEGKKEQALRLIPECIYLTYAAADELEMLGLAKYSLVKLDKRTYGPLICLYQSVAGNLGTIKTSFQAFSKSSDLPKIFELSAKEAWVKFCNDFNEHISLVATNKD